MNEFLTQIDAGMGYTGDVMASTLAHPEEWMFEAFGGGISDSGERVNVKSAKGHGPVWQAINILAGDVGQLPIHVSRKSGEKIERFDEHPVEWLLAHEPNAFQTPSRWKETMVAWMAGWGNGCSWILRDGGGRPYALWPLLPDRTRPMDVEGEWWIETDLGDGKRFPIPYTDVFHLPWLGDDDSGGFWGIGPIQACKNTIATGLALRKHGNKTFANGGRPGGALEIPGGEPKPEVMREKRAQLEAMHSGAENAGKWLLLFGGTKYAQLAMNNDDAQWLESLDLDREFIASLFNLPPYKLGSMKNSSTRANTEQQNTDYLNNSLSRHLNKFREEVRRKLFTYGERRLMRIDVDWTYEAFLRADLAARGAYYSQAKTGEWMTTNEIRKIEGLNPVKGGDEIKNPAINPATPKPEPAKEEPATKEDSPPDNSNARAVARDLIFSQVAALLDTEAKNVQKKCSEPRRFVQWAEDYYEKYTDLSRRYLDAPSKLAIHVGLGRVDWHRAVCEHARNSLTRLLSMAGIATSDSLPGVGEEFADSLASRKESLALAVLGE